VQKLTKLYQGITAKALTFTDSVIYDSKVDRFQRIYD
jgi:hypothetical protein